jgi:imidazolonepropionase-like amidohydrolase
MTRTRFLALSLAFALSFFVPRVFAASQQEVRSAQPPLIIENVTIIDTAGGPLQTNMTVVVSAGRIDTIGKSAGFQDKPRKGELVVDGRGKYLIPGLWDMHTHIAGINAQPKWSKNVLIPLLIANGITGIRDMGGDLDALESWRREIENGQMTGPTIVAAGPMLLPARRAASPPAPPDPAVLNVGSPDEARSIVDSLQKRGADFIKVIQLPREEYFAVAAEAKHDGIPFVGHIPTRVTAIEASNAGQKSVEHIIYSSLAFDCSSKEEELRKKGLDASARGDEQGVADATDEANHTFSSENAAALWSTFRRNGTWVTPTLFSIRVNAHRLEDSKDDPQLAYLPVSLRKEWEPPKSPTKDDRDTAEWWERQFENDRKLTGEMHRAGVRLLAGSDSLDRYAFVGTSLHAELKQLVDAGLTPLEALQTATRNPADFLGRNDTGIIAAGKRADLVLLDANPLDDIANTQKISSVVLKGRYLSRADLDSMLSSARAAAADVPADQKAPN